MSCRNSLCELRGLGCARELGSARAAISDLLAEPRDWSVDGIPSIWPGLSGWWPKQSPILFPVVGWTRNGEMRIKGKRYPLGLHGFASTQAFEIASRTQESVRMQLRDNAATRALYPFAFELDVDYRLSPTSLAASFTVHNPGAEPLPYALGLHPGSQLSPWPAAARKIITSCSTKRSRRTCR